LVFAIQRNEEKNSRNERKDREITHWHVLPF
jgi:hypothetical protein